MKKINGKIVTKRDVIIIGAILLVAISGFLFFAMREPASEDTSELIAVVTVDGKETFRLPLNKAEVVFSPKNPNVVLEVTGEGTVHFLASDCPDKVCIETGFLKRSGQSASCLPNKTIVVVEHEEDKAEPDVDITV